MKASYFIVYGFLTGFSCLSWCAPKASLIYEQACHACHALGVYGAPKKGDVQAWKKRIQDKTMPILVEHVQRGFKAMPPQGRCVACTPEEIEAVIKWMSQPSVNANKPITYSKK